MELLTKLVSPMTPFYKIPKSENSFAILSQLGHNNLLDFSEQNFASNSNLRCIILK